MNTSLVLDYCLLTGGPCVHQTEIKPNLFFIAEPYDKKRHQREKAIKNAIQNYEYVIADNSSLNISITCKICQQVQSTHFGIVDITGLNENVLIELGLLYGMRKPTIILIHKKEDIIINIPSNIPNVEQIRYEDFEDLELKLKYMLENILNIPTFTENIINPKLLIKKIIMMYEFVLNLKKREQNLTIINKQIINDANVLIINAGTEDSIFEKLIFEIFFLQQSQFHEPIHVFVGAIIVFFVQKEISQTYIADHDPTSDFWIKLFSNDIILEHFLKPRVPEALDEKSIQELEEFLKRYNQIYSLIQ